MMQIQPNPQAGLPLDRVRVLELAHIVAGPSAGLILADLGADVLKIEHPDVGDTARNQANQGAGFLSFNRNKESLALNLSDPKGKEIFAKLVAEADVVVNNYVPGALDRLGLGYEWARSINPKIIYCAVKGFLPGPYWSRPLLDELAQMAGGLAYLTGSKEQPLRAGASITDIGAATYGVVGILAALYRRQITGEGENIESGLFETIVFWLNQHLARAQISGKDPEPRAASKESGMGKMMGWGVYQLFDTKDDQRVFIAVTSNRHWISLCRVLGFDDWMNSPDFNNNRKRTARKPQITARVTDAVKRFTYDEITEGLYREKVPFAPVNSPSMVLEDRHLAEGDRWLQVEGAGKRVKVPKLPLAMSNTAFVVRRHPPTLGQHTDDVLRRLGYSATEIESLKTAGIVRRSERMLEIDKDGE
jgi:crotonobetainyl-CoA:carnitine CoA-transferase CaiB-like acyl-CoA transferase